MKLKNEHNTQGVQIIPGASKALRLLRVNKTGKHLNLAHIVITK